MKTNLHLSLIGVLLLTSCAGTGVKTDGTGDVTEARPNDAIAQVIQKENGGVEASRPASIPTNKAITAHEIENLKIDDVIRLEEPNTANLYDNSRYDFPITINSRVEGWIDYFTGRGRGHMERYLARSGRYIPVMKKIFQESGMPPDLVYLALIESGFNLRAKSRARAVGPWQFMKATGKRYGLRVDNWVDERRDPLLATEAAARYLKDLYLMFESWYLAASAYNAGEYKILRAIESTKTNNYWRICETRTIRRETKDYVPKLIAAAIIAKNAKKYGFEDVSYMEPLEFETLQVNYPIHLREIAKMVDAQEDEILDLNPAFVKSIVPNDQDSYELRVPVGTKLVVQRALASDKGRLQYTAAREPVRKAKTEQRAVAAIPETDGDFVVHTVKEGESLWSISEQYNCTVQNIFRWNNLKRSQIHPGRKLKVKAKGSAGNSRNHKARTKTRRS